MTRTTRDETLQRITTFPIDPVVDSTDRPLPEQGPDSMDWDELGQVIEGLALGQRPVRAGAYAVTREFDLGPRGAYILSLISAGLIYPMEIASVLKMQRSLTTAELDRLKQAGLITAKPGAKDRRKSELAVTPAGRKASERVRENFARILRRNLATYSVDEIRLFIRMLRDVRRLEADESED